MKAIVAVIVLAVVRAFSRAVPKLLVVVLARRVFIIVEVVIMVVVTARALVQVIGDVLLLVAGHPSA